MLTIIEKHFQTLFAGATIRQEDTERYVRKIKRKIDLEEEEEARLLQPVTEEEVKKAIGQGREASAPGPDGLGYGFYQRYKDLLAAPLADAFNTAMKHEGKFSREFFGGNLHLIYKDVGDPHSLQNWRPINISNVDYRIWARILNNRLAAVADRMTVEGQTSAVPGRRMADSLKTARQIMTMVRKAEWGGWMVNMDQSKAFDRVYRPYLWKVLEKKGVPGRFIRWLQLIYEDAHVTPMVNGQRGKAIDQNQGLRQGCPLSPLLYVIALDPLLERVQQDPRMLGVPMGDGQESDIKITTIAHADDATFFINTPVEFEHLKRHTEEYAKASGAAINHDKSQVLRLLRGSRDHRMKVTNLQQQQPEEKGPSDSRQEEEWTEHVRVLGIWFGLADGAWKHNWTLWKEKVMFQLKRWKQWHLSIYQRAQYVATYCLPGANFLSAIYPPPQKLLKDVEREMFQFILGTVHFPLNRAETYKRVEEGGLGVKALAPWLMSNFLSANFRAWWDAIGKLTTETERTGHGGRIGKTRVQAMWAAFGTNWANTRWAQRWWWEEGRMPFRLTEALTAPLPDYLSEAARHIQELKLHARICKQGEERERGSVGPSEATQEEEIKRERAVRKELYEQAVTEALEQARKSRQLRASVVSKYRLDDEAAKEVFAKSKDIPFSLWETRWRAYHQVFKVGATQPWLTAEKRICQRCQTAGKKEETIEHYVKACPQATSLWQAISRRLDWPELAAQQWETIVSGIEPQQQQQTKGPKGKRVPWKLKRLTNLYVLMAIGLHRKKDMVAGRGRQTPPEPWVEFVLKRMRRSAQWEKENLKDKKKWQAKWGWMTEVHPPIT